MAEEHHGGRPQEDHEGVGLALTPEEVEAFERKVDAEAHQAIGRFVARMLWGVFQWAVYFLLLFALMHATNRFDWLWLASLLEDSVWLKVAGIAVLIIFSTALYLFSVWLRTLTIIPARKPGHLWPGGSARLFVASDLFYQYNDRNEYNARCKA